MAQAWDFFYFLFQPWTSLVTQMVKHLPIVQETQVQSLGQEDLLEKEMATHSSILTWKIPWTEEPGRATVHVIAKSRTRLSDFTFTFLSSHSPGRSQAPLPLRRVFLCLFSFVLFFSIAFHKRLTTNFILGVLIPLPCCIQTEGFILHCNPNLKHQH